MPVLPDNTIWRSPVSMTQSTLAGPGGHAGWVGLRACLSLLLDGKRLPGRRGRAGGQCHYATREDPSRRRQQACCEDHVCHPGGRRLRRERGMGRPRSHQAGVFSRVIDLLDSKLFESTILNELGSLASASQDYRETVKTILEIMARVVGNAVGDVLMFEEEDMVVSLN